MQFDGIMERINSEDITEPHCIIKRDGSIEDLRLVAIEERIDGFTKRFGLFQNTYAMDGRIHPPSTYVNEIFIKVVREVSKRPPSVPISTYEIDEITYNVAEKLALTYPDASRLAAIIRIDNLHRSLRKNHGMSILGVINRAKDNCNPYTGEQFGILDEYYCDFVRKHEAELTEIMDYDRDFDYPLAGVRVLEKQYLTKAHLPSNNTDRYTKTVIESPQDMMMRVAVYLHMHKESPLDDIRETYLYLSQRRIIPATPILLRAGTKHASLSSCYLGSILDSIEGIGKSVSQAMEASKGGGGLAFRIDNLRARGAYIKRTNGFSAGPIPFVEIFDTVARHVNQGGHRRGSIAFYMSLWHMDIEEFIRCRTEFGNGIKALDIFTGVYVPNIFMERLARGEAWTLFCPSVAHGLVKKYGAEFDRHYRELEIKYAGQPCCRSIPIDDLAMSMYGTKIVTGMPYVMDMDSIVGQHNLVYDEDYTANLCTEVALPVNEKSNGQSVCNLSAVGSAANLHYDSSLDTKKWPVKREVPLFRDPTQKLTLPNKLVKYHPAVVARMEEYRYIRGREGMSVDLLGIAASSYVATQMLNRVIDVNVYPNKEAEEICKRDRPIGIGQQGFADCLTMLGYGFDHPQSRVVNRAIAATIYYFSLLSSIDYARENAAAPCVENTRLRMFGQTQPDIYKAYTGRDVEDFPFLDRAYVVEQSLRYGFANGVHTASQPTETSAKLNGVSEMWEPRKGLIFSMKNENVVDVIINTIGIQMLNSARLWTADLIRHVRLNGGSVAEYEGLPADVRDMFKTIYEYDQFMLLDFVADREPYISMAQSTNIYLVESTVQAVAELDMYAHELKLRTRSYYARIIPAKTFRPAAVLADESNATMVHTDMPSCMMCQ